MGFFWKTPTVTDRLAGEQRFQKIKTDIHRKLVEMIDITNLTQWKHERLQREVSQLAKELIDASPEKLDERSGRPGGCQLHAVEPRDFA